MNIGFGSEIPAEFIRIILHAHGSCSRASAPAVSSPIRRLMARAEADGRLVNATHGRKTRSVIITNSNQVVQSAVLPETLKLHFEEERRNEAAGP